MELIFETRRPADPAAEVWRALPLPSEERLRARRVITLEDGLTLRLLLPRGTVLRHGDLLGAREDGRLLRIEAAPEPVLTVRADDAHTLLRAAYHLGNRHVPVEVGRDYLRLSPDPVLAEMLTGLGVQLAAEVAPFEPEAGAYQGHGHHHGHGLRVNHLHAHAH